VKSQFDPERTLRFCPNQTFVMAATDFRAHSPTITARYVAFIGDEIAGRAPVLLQQERERMQKRRRFKQTKSLKDRLLEEAQSLREQAKLLPFGAVRDATLKKARQAEAAANMDAWLNSPGLQPPKRVGTPDPN
jgi:hypothetical protein